MFSSQMVALKIEVGTIKVSGFFGLNGLHRTPLDCHNLSFRGTYKQQFFTES